MKKAFTLAEVLITLAIIGVVAAITIPSVIVNTNQMEFKTGLRKAVSVLNQAITLNKALTGESPYDNGDLYNYLQQYMAVMQNNAINNYDDSTYINRVFYTTDGMRFEILYEADNPSLNQTLRLYETDNTYARLYYVDSGGTLGNCGSMGLAHNPDSTTSTPCIITVDVNGDRKPSPQSLSNTHRGSYTSTIDGTTYDLIYYAKSKYADPNGRLLTDVFSIMITDTGAIPYGVVAQKAMYQAQK